MLYQFKDGPVRIRNAKRADPQKLGEAYENAGRDDEVLHDLAKNPRHPWHKHLEWDDTVAGRLYRLDQIQHIVRLLWTVPSGKDEPAPAFISLAKAKAHRARYTPDEVVNSGELQVAALAAAERDLEAFRQRYRMFSDLCEDAEAMIEKIRSRRAAASGSHAAA